MKGNEYRVIWAQLDSKGVQMDPLGPAFVFIGSVYFRRKGSARLGSGASDSIPSHSSLEIGDDARQVASAEARGVRDMQVDMYVAPGLEIRSADHAFQSMFGAITSFSMWINEAQEFSTWASTMPWPTF